jgi:hypothetical protein
VFKNQQYMSESIEKLVERAKAKSASFKEKDAGVGEDK